VIVEARRPFSEALDVRLEELRRAPAYRNYEYVRDRVLRMKDLETSHTEGVGAPSAYWAEELEGFEYMLDASPLVIEKLRQHTFHVTGLRVYDYRTHKDRYRAQVERKLDALIEIAGGRELLVPESRILGGFGFDIDGELYNLDTLKFFESLIAMDLGAVLSEFRTSSDRKVVWEIGAGWGGLAYQFKTLCPHVTYVITDFPELFLFSAVYLMTSFPEARVVFYGDNSSEILSDWGQYDFVFLPHTRIHAVTPPRLDLVINTVSFQEMTTEQVDAYVQHAHTLQCPFIYSLNRERSLYNPDLLGVRRILDRCYWTHEINVLPVSYVHMLDESMVISRAKWAKDRARRLAQKVTPAADDLDYKHLIGWRRVRT
jgi:putative sugar O-methyltransferase